MPQRSRASALRLVGRVYLPRVTGLGFAFLGLSYFLIQFDAGWATWVLLVVWGLIWPHLAHQRARRSPNPLRAEILNLYVDAFMMGFWVPVMHFNAVPSLAILYMHTLSIMSVLGLRGAAWCIVVEAAGIAVSSAVYGFHFEPHSELIHLFISLPMMVVYPLYVGYNAHWLANKLAVKQAQLRKLSQIDGLTGLYNRTYLEEQVAREFARIRRGGPAASLVFVDVDRFKAINDQHGHLVGDEVIRQIAGLLRDCAREADLCGRYGGEEFVVLMPGTDLDSARQAAERLRGVIGDASLHPNLDIRTTISIGVAEIDDADPTYSHWLDRADRALYVAKQQGRNVTVCAE